MSHKDLISNIPPDEFSAFIWNALNDFYIFQKYIYKIFDDHNIIPDFNLYEDYQIFRDQNWDSSFLDLRRFSKNLFARIQSDAKDQQDIS